MGRKPWSFAATLRLAAIALLLAMLSFMVDGWSSALLTIVAAVLALFGVMEFAHAWRWRSTHRE
jgi:hypothetical protein